MLTYNHNVRVRLNENMLIHLEIIRSPDEAGNKVEGIQEVGSSHHKINGAVF